MPRSRALLAAAAALAVAGCGESGDAAGRPGTTTQQTQRERQEPSQPAAPAPTTQTQAQAPPAIDPAPEVVMVRRAGGVPAGWGERLRRIDGVTAVTRATRAQAMLRATGARSVPAGFAIPLDTLVIRPGGYAAMLPADARAAVRRLGPGRALLSRTSARLRDARTGSTLTLAGGRRLRVAGIVDDGLVRSAELVVSASEGARLADRAPYLLAAVRTEKAARRAARTFDAPRTRVTALGPAPWSGRGRIARTVDSRRASASSPCACRSAPTGSRPTRPGCGATSAAPACRSSDR